MEKLMRRLVTCLILLIMPVFVLAGCFNEEPVYYTVNFDFRAGGTVMVEIDGEEIEHAAAHLEGSVFTITVIPDVGYEILSVRAGTVDLPGEDGIYTHTLDGNVTFRVRFTESDIGSE